jgi:hypothetical protein
VNLGSVCSKKDYSAGLKNHVNLSKENIQCSKLQHLTHCLIVRIEMFLKIILSANQHFLDGERLLL